MADENQTTNQPLARMKQTNKSESHGTGPDCTAESLQHDLATWICPKCRLHYSRQAAASVQWRCEECQSSLIDASGQKAA